MKFKTLILLIITIFTFGLPKKIQKKVDKEIEEVFAVESFTFTEKALPLDIAKSLPSQFNSNNLFEIKKDQIVLGYAYVAKAPSKTAKFDYLVLFDSDWVIKGSKVLIYREEYGGEISSTRWLRQFNGKTHKDDFRYGDNIDAISGATISVRSMTHAMNDLMESISLLKSKGVL